MRFALFLIATSALSACGGGGPTTAGGTAVGSPIGGVTPGSGHTFVKPTEQKTYQAIGGAHSYNYATDDRGTAGQYSQLYQGNASTARDSGITVNYNPRDAIFEITIREPLAGTDRLIRFQDPIHRTAFGGVREPQSGTPNYESDGVVYLEAGFNDPEIQFDPNQSTTFPVGPEKAGLDYSTFFYQKPGTSTSYVTFAGFVRNAISVSGESDTETSPDYLRQTYQLQRAAFVFGERTPNGAVPTSGTGSYTGPMIATMVFNPLADLTVDAPTYFQWLNGTATTTIDFGASTFSLALTGTVGAPGFDVFTNRLLAVQQGSTFTAAGSGRVDMINKGGFLGAINSAAFVDTAGVTRNLNVGGSSVDGTFYGPKAEEVGGGFRIVGGTPDERIDILGAFTGKKPGG